MSDANLTLPQGGHATSTSQRSSSSANISFPLLTVIPHVGFESSHVSILTCLGWCNVQIVLIFFLNIYTFFIISHSLYLFIFPLPSILISLFLFPLIFLYFLSSYSHPLSMKYKKVLSLSLSLSLSIFWCIFFF